MKKKLTELGVPMNTWEAVEELWYRVNNGKAPDALVMAHAPELLARLKDLVDGYRREMGPCGCGSGPDRCIACDADAALLKAEGGGK